jgi:hypothetical protein
MSGLNDRNGEMEKKGGWWQSLMLGFTPTIGKKFVVFILFLICVFKTDQLESETLKFENRQFQDSINIKVISPSGSCKYSAILYREGLIKVSSSQFSDYQLLLNDTNTQRLNEIFNELNSVNYIGELWKDAWKYEIYLNSEKKILTYMKKENLYVIEIIGFIEGNIKGTFIDYKCF